MTLERLEIISIASRLIRPCIELIFHQPKNINPMKKFLLSFLSLFLIASMAHADVETIDLSFSKIGSTGWTSTYTNHTVDTDVATVLLAQSNKQSSNITDIPVTKGNPVTVTFKEGIIPSYIKFVFRQWTTKAQTATLYTSVDGTNFTSTNISSSNFSLEGELASNVVAAKVQFSSTSNQIGIQSIEITYSTSTIGDTREEVELSWSESEVSAELGGVIS